MILKLGANKRAHSGRPEARSAEGRPWGWAQEGVAPPGKGVRECYPRENFGLWIFQRTKLMPNYICMSAGLRHNSWVAPKSAFALSCFPREQSKESNTLSSIAHQSVGEILIEIIALHLSKFVVSLVISFSNGTFCFSSFVWLPFGKMTVSSRLFSSRTLPVEITTI